MFSVKNQIVNILRIVVRTVSIATIQTCFCGRIQIQTVSKWTRWLCSKKLYGWILTFEFHLNFMCHEVFYHLPPTQTVKNVKPSSGHTKTSGRLMIRPTGHNSLMPVFDEIRNVMNKTSHGYVKDPNRDGQQTVLIFKFYCVYFNLWFFCIFFFFLS